MEASFLLSLNDATERINAKRNVKKPCWGAFLDRKSDLNVQGEEWSFHRSNVSEAWKTRQALGYYFQYAPLVWASVRKDINIQHRTALPTARAQRCAYKEPH